MIATTTSNSIKVKPACRVAFVFIERDSNSNLPLKTKLEIQNRSTRHEARGYSVSAAITGNSIAAATTRRQLLLVRPTNSSDFISPDEFQSNRICAFSLAIDSLTEGKRP